MFLKKSFLFFMILVLSVSLAAESKNNSPQNILNQITKGEPTFDQVIQATFEREDLGFDGIDALEKKMKKAPWLPTLYAGYDLSTKKTSDISITDNISVSSSGVTIGPDDNNWSQNVYDYNVFRIRAVWELNELVFPSDSLSVQKQKQELVKLRLTIREYIFKIYTQRRQFQVQAYFLRKTKGPKFYLINQKIQDLTERLNDMTGGVFSTQWKKGN